VLQSRHRELTSIKDALVPIARLCLQTGKGAGEMILATKLACIEVAAEKAMLGNRLNLSQISAITGLTRRDVRVLTNVAKSKDVDSALGSEKNRIGRVLSGWTTDPEFLDRHGAPLALTTKSTDAAFRALVGKYAGDVTPISVLRELRRVGAVRRTADGKIVLKRSHVRAKGFTSDAIAEISRRLRDLGTALVENVGNTDSPVYASYQSVQALVPDEAALFHATFSERAASLLNGVSIWTRSQARLKRKGTVGSLQRLIDVGIGVYLIKRSNRSARSGRRAARE
jgi:hypothetical protein